MNTNYNIRNFRVFGKEGANVKIAPLTVLTGCNSSGKSSIAKSILLLDTYLHKVKCAADNKSEFDLGNYTIDFDEYPLNLLGRFDKVLNSSATSGEIEFRYIAENGFEVALTFTTREEDILNRGYLKKLVVYKGDIEVFATQNGACYLNVVPFIEMYLKSTKARLTPNCTMLPFDLDATMSYQRNHKVSLDAIKWADENKSLFRIPILDKIGNLTREEFVNHIDAILSSAYNELSGLEQVVQRLKEVFNLSECVTFSDFIKLREKEWMSHLSNEHDIDFAERLMIPQDWSHVQSDCSVPDEGWEMLLRKIAEGDERWIKKLNNASFRFPFLLTTLVNIGLRIGLPMDKAYSERLTIFDECIGDEKHITIHYMWEDFKKIVDEKLKGALIPKWNDTLSYVGSSRIDVKRLYTLDSKSDFASLLNRYFNARRDFVGLQEYKDEKGYKPDAFINKWLKNFGICDSVSLNMDSEGLGVSIRLHKGDRTTLLADEGYGITQLFSILLEIETGIQKAFQHFLVKGWIGQNYVYVTDMGTDKVLFPEQTIIIEEPEIHLHPKFQSLLVDMFAEAMKEYNIHFIIETHSEYLIRRLQLRVAEKKIPCGDVSVIYVDDDSNPYNMGLAENGRFSRDFGPGFFDEADNAAIRLFDINNE